jgi:hypothetical protein
MMDIEIQDKFPSSLNKEVKFKMKFLVQKSGYIVSQILNRDEKENSESNLNELVHERKTKGK